MRNATDGPSLTPILRHVSSQIFLGLVASVTIEKMKFPIIAVALALAASVNAEVPSLTPDNYDEMTDGKTVFIKFFAPWCKFTPVESHWSLVTDCLIRF
jgi:thiol-disulfide isomerase/thioredoxin